MRRDHVASTLIRRHFDVVCLLGVHVVFVSCSEDVHTIGYNPQINLITFPRFERNHLSGSDTIEVYRFHYFFFPRFGLNRFFFLFFFFTFS